MRYLRTFEELEIVNKHSSDKSYSSPFITGEHFTYDIIDNDTRVGDIEWGEVDGETIEIISIHIEKEYRGKNYGLEATNLLIKETGSKRVILKSAPSSKKYWRHLGYEKIKGTIDYFEKYF
jgi:RimJ/RimL family protein N-acetyltransferase